MDRGYTDRQAAVYYIKVFKGVISSDYRLSGRCVGVIRAEKKYKIFIDISI